MLHMCCITLLLIGGSANKDDNCRKKPAEKTHIAPECRGGGVV